MLASDFIDQVKDDLQEKTEQWSKESLLVKLQRAYVALQFDLPYFMTMEDIAIKQEQTEYYLKQTFIKDVSLLIDGRNWEYTDIDNLFISTASQKLYSFHGGKLILNQRVLKDTPAKIAYKYQKKLKTKNCHIEIPAEWHEALRFSLMSKIHEKPTRNTKERDLSKHYLNLYSIEVNKLKLQQKARPKSIGSKYQII